MAMARQEEKDDEEDDAEQGAWSRKSVRRGPSVLGQLMFFVVNSNCLFLLC